MRCERVEAEFEQSDKEFEVPEKASQEVEINLKIEQTRSGNHQPRFQLASTPQLCQVAEQWLMGNSLHVYLVCPPLISPGPDYVAADATRLETTQSPNSSNDPCISTHQPSTRSSPHVSRSGPSSIGRPSQESPPITRAWTDFLSL